MLIEETLVEARLDMACRRELEVGEIGVPGRDMRAFYRNFRLNTLSLEDCFPPRVTLLAFFPRVRRTSFSF